MWWQIAVGLLVRLPLLRCADRAVVRAYRRQPDGWRRSQAAAEQVSSKRFGNDCTARRAKDRSYHSPGSELTSKPKISPTLLAGGPGRNAKNQARSLRIAGGEQGGSGSSAHESGAHVGPARNGSVVPRASAEPEALNPPVHGRMSRDCSGRRAPPRFLAAGRGNALPHLVHDTCHVAAPQIE